MKEGSHGMPVSFEYLKEKNPDWLFVLDRSAAIGEEGQAAKDVLNNPLVAETIAWKKGQVVYLDSGTYLAAGGARQFRHLSRLFCLYHATVSAVRLQLAVSFSDAAVCPQNPDARYPAHRRGHQL